LWSFPYRCVRGAWAGDGRTGNADRSIPSSERWRICGLSGSFRSSFPSRMRPASYRTDRAIRHLQPFPKPALLEPIWPRLEGASSFSRSRCTRSAHDAVAGTQAATACSAAAPDVPKQRISDGRCLLFATGIRHSRSPIDVSQSEFAAGEQRPLDRVQHRVEVEAHILRKEAQHEMAVLLDRLVFATVSAICIDAF